MQKLGQQKNRQILAPDNKVARSWGEGIGSECGLKIQILIFETGGY